ncbi:hypothetical protein THAOC_31174 [Thalassiosira oceanica]|uniref:Uncharacterized protein n=1 Tax=Thalassiosira oceanica TaxID=159749 RepID=K0R9T3_THAOC|nr:hypothetical protein THAOC_31174 [Thalassiosira oceanica]|eukprot:EJK49900.1 hypothetical protein THAOC_31174 [Thalassiosira oceanica]
MSASESSNSQPRNRHRRTMVNWESSVVHRRRWGGTRLTRPATRTSSACYNARRPILLLLLLSPAAIRISQRFSWRTTRALIRAQVFELFRGNTDETCTKQGLLPKYDVIVGGYRYMEDDRQIPLDENHYIWNLNLPNSTIYWYRRVKAEIEPARMSYPGKKPSRISSNPECIESGKMRLEERVLPANRGRDAAALIDHILQIYDDGNSSSFPDYLLFLHGHVAHGYHTSCEAVFARTATQYKYAQKHVLGNVQNVTDPTSILADHMTTLTSAQTDLEPQRSIRGYTIPEKGSDTTNLRLDYKARLNKEFEFGGDSLLGFDTKEVDEYSVDNTMTCQSFYEKWIGALNETDKKTRRQWRSCCASFVFPAKRILRLPKSFWEDLMKVHMRPTDQDKYRGRFCFEQLIYTLLGDQVDDVNKNVYNAALEGFYEEAIQSMSNRRLQYAIDYCDTAILRNEFDLRGWVVYLLCTYFIWKILGKVSDLYVLNSSKSNY